MTAPTSILTISRDRPLQNTRTIILERAGYTVSAALTDKDAVAFVETPALMERDNGMTPITKPIPKLRKAPQPPLAYPGATPDSHRAKRPPLVTPKASKQELDPGDRVEGLGNFGKPTGEVGTVERTNEEDAVVKWDGDGRTRVHQPWLKKA